MKNSKALSYGRIAFLGMALFACVTMLLNEGCSEKRNPSLSLVEEQPAVKEPTKFRYSSSPQPNLNVKPLFDDNCVRCHNYDMQTKVPLTNYLQVYTGGSVVRRSIQPGGSMQKYVKFDYSMIVEWIEGGMPE